ncbi:MAG: DUF3489 domain-containing protein [Alphaproteobacteria bacterium]
MTEETNKTKKQTIIDMLKSPKGATRKEMQDATNWQKHTVRSFISRAKSKMNFKIISDKSEEGDLVYKIETVNPIPVLI